MLPLRNLTRLRKERSTLTQEQLAVAVGVSASMLRILEHGRASLDRDAVIERIADELGCSVLDLYGVTLTESDQNDEPGRVAAVA
jgi:transcriptional regulator with XRE-family HTH domain